MGLLDIFSACFSRDSTHDYDVSPSDSTPESAQKCIFCKVTKGNGFDVVWEDEKFIVFKDYKAAAEHHLLVIPRRHIGSVKSLQERDADMVKEMAEIGHARLDELQVPPTARRMGFHIPPFNSVNHLHLHVLSLPFRTPFHRAKYPFANAASGSGLDKGWTWFAEVGQTIRILEKGRRVGVMPC